LRVGCCCFFTAQLTNSIGGFGATWHCSGVHEAVRFTVNNHMFL
uniref:Envelope glycoprotein n=1 Tax=Haemonchus placei TaxID=6290 RepID=A0A0N4WH26_HAEPC